MPSTSRETPQAGYGAWFQPACLPPAPHTVDYSRPAAKKYIYASGQPACRGGAKHTRHKRLVTVRLSALSGACDWGYRPSR